MKHLLLRTAALAAAVALTALPAASQIIVVDGDDLPAIVAAAPSGSVVEIDSDGIFTGQVVIAEDKDLVLRAAPGRAPIIDGGLLPDVAIEVGHATVRLEGLRLYYSNGWGRSLTVSGPDFLPGEVLTVEVEDCELLDDLYAYPRGPGLLDLDVTGVEILAGGFSFQQAFGSTIDLDAADCTVKALKTAPADDCSSSLRLEDCLIDGFGALPGLPTLGYAEAPFLVELIRCHVVGGVSLGPIHFSAPTVAPQPRLYAESCLFEGYGLPGIAGILLDDPSAWGGMELELRGCTVTNFATGIALPSTPQAAGAVRLRNTLLTNNATDLTGNLTGGSFVRNLAEDIDLGPGNKQQQALLDADLALLPSSPGTDDGIGIGLAPGATDLLGNPRVVDVDCDGIAEVSIGAIEAPPSLLAGVSVFSGGNPAGTQVSLPVVGAVLEVQVDLGPQGILGFAAVGAPLGTPFQIPGWKGSLLLDPAGFSLYTTPTGILKLPIPLDLSLVGLPISLQGASAEISGGPVKVQLLDRVDLTLGY